jgi:hypothetical protein
MTDLSLMTDLSQAQEAVHQTLVVVVIQTGRQMKRQAMFAIQVKQ